MPFAPSSEQCSKEHRTYLGNLGGNCGTDGKDNHAYERRPPLNMAMDI